MGYPAGFDNLTNPAPADDTAVPASGAQKHSDQHGLVNNAVEGLEHAVGLNATSPTAGKFLKSPSDDHSVWASINTDDVADFDINSPSNGDLLQYNAGTGKWQKATVPLVTDLVWEGDSVPSGGFIGP